MVQWLSPPSSADDMGSIPSWGTKIAHAAWQLSPHAATAEPKHPSPCSAMREATAMRSLHTTTRENPAQLKVNK